MNEILDGVTREEALGCVKDKGLYEGTSASGHLEINGERHECPGHIGLSEASCGVGVRCVDCWRAAINTRYDALEAEKKPKWNIPTVSAQFDVGGLRSNLERFYNDTAVSDERIAEIARTNAYREVAAFIAANGGKGSWKIWHDPSSGCFQAIAYGSVELMDIGTITCATRELAEEVIRRFPDQLKILGGVK